MVLSEEASTCHPSWAEVLNSEGQGEKMFQAVILAEMPANAGSKSN